MSDNVIKCFALIGAAVSTGVVVIVAAYVWTTVIKPRFRCIGNRLKLRRIRRYTKRLRAAASKKACGGDLPVDCQNCAHVYAKASEGWLAYHCQAKHLRMTHTWLRAQCCKSFISRPASQYAIPLEPAPQTAQNHDANT